MKLSSHISPLGENKARDNSLGYFLHKLSETFDQIENNKEQQASFTDFIKKLEYKTGLLFIPEAASNNLCFANNNSELRDDFKRVFSPVEIFDYHYALLITQALREETMSSIPYDFSALKLPRDAEDFWDVVNWGNRLRKLHLLECSDLDQVQTHFPVEGNNKITRDFRQYIPEFMIENKAEGRVYINPTQYFDQVPSLVWTLKMGPNQPVQDFLLQHNGKVLSSEKIMTFYKIVGALSETFRVVAAAQQLIAKF